MNTVASPPAPRLRRYGFCLQGANIRVQAEVWETGVFTAREVLQRSIVQLVAQLAGFAAGESAAECGIQLFELGLGQQAPETELSGDR
jgi:hypothetical protein